jgi:multidrug resistance efflux pump
MKCKLFLPMILILALVACASGARTPAAIPTVNLGSNAATSVPASTNGGSGVTASGIVVADQQASLAFSLPGNVKLFSVVPGNQVQAGQTLVQLDDTTQQIALDQANLALQELTSPAAVANAELAVTTAQKQVIDAQTTQLNTQYWQNKDLQQNYYASYVIAKDNLDKAQTAYDNAHVGQYINNSNEAAAYQNLYNAKKAYDTAFYFYSVYSQTPTQRQLDEAKANLDLANATLANARVYLAALTGGTVPADATGTDLLKLKQARLAVQTAQANWNATRLVAPFSGEVASVTTSVGDYVLPGQVILVISDVNHMHVETTDLSERDVPKVTLGQGATVSIKALNRDVSGKVSAISPLADTLGGDVVYKVIIRLDTLPSNLRAGMSVDVQFNTSP